MMHAFVEINLSESDKRSLILLGIIFAIFFIILGLFGVLIYKTMKWQGKQAQDYMYKPSVTHVITNKKKYRQLAFKKNWRLFYQQSFIPFLFLLLALLVWLVFSIVNESWNENIFEQFGDLFFVFDWSGATTKVFNLTLLAKWPDLIRGPEPKIEHLCSYIVVPLIIVGTIGYFFAGQSALSRGLDSYFTPTITFHTSLRDKRLNELDPSLFGPSDDELGVEEKKPTEEEKK